jgi:hypothetical protein
MKYAVEIGSCAMICIPCFMKIDTGVLSKGLGEVISLLLFFKNKGSRQKNGK